jgi:site-specific recombinase XerD
MVNLPGRQQFEEWLDSKNLSQRSVSQYLYYYDKFGETILTQETVNNFLELQFNNTVSRAFIKNLIEFYLQHSSELKLTKEDIADVSIIRLAKSSGRKKIRVPKILTPEDIKELEEVMTNDRNKVMLLLTYYAGLRLAELLSIRPKDFNWKKFDAEMETEPGELNIIGKGNKERICILPVKIMKKVRDWINEFASTDSIVNNSPMFDIGEDRWGDIIKWASGKAWGINENTKKPNIRLYPHALRAGIASYLRSQGMDIMDIRDFLGHADISTTSIYLSVNREDLKNKYTSIMG